LEREKIFNVCSLAASLHHSFTFYQFITKTQEHGEESIGEEISNGEEISIGEETSIKENSHQTLRQMGQK